MNIRSTTSKDSEAIKSLVFPVLEEYGLKPDPGTTDKDLDNIEEFYFLSSLRMQLKKL